jgi:hypothetical protein
MTIKEIVLLRSDRVVGLADADPFLQFLLPDGANGPAAVADQVSIIVCTLHLPDGKTLRLPLSQLDVSVTTFGACLLLPRLATHVFVRQADGAGVGSYSSQLAVCILALRLSGMQPVLALCDGASAYDKLLVEWDPPPVAYCVLHFLKLCKNKLGHGGVNVDGVHIVMRDFECIWHAMRPTTGGLDSARRINAAVFLVDSFNAMSERNLEGFVSSDFIRIVETYSVHGPEHYDDFHPSREQARACLKYLRVLADLHALTSPRPISSRSELTKIFSAANAARDTVLQWRAKCTPDGSHRNRGQRADAGVERAEFLSDVVTLRGIRDSIPKIEAAAFHIFDRMKSVKLLDVSTTNAVENMNSILRRGLGSHDSNPTAEMVTIFLNRELMRRASIARAARQ